MTYLEWAKRLGFDDEIIEDSCPAFEMYVENGRETRYCKATLKEECAKCWNKSMTVKEVEENVKVKRG